jgi:hypothetical protein
MLFLIILSYDNDILHIKIVSYSHLRSHYPLALWKHRKNLLNILITYIIIGKIGEKTTYAKMCTG